MRASRTVPAVLILLAVLAVGWWGIDAFLAVDDVGGGGTSSGLLDQPLPGGDDASDAEAPPPGEGAPTVPAPRDDETGGERLRPARSRAATPVEDEPEASPVPEPPPGEPPVSVVGVAGDPVIVGNTWSTPADREEPVEEGDAWIGTPQVQVDGMLAARGISAPAGLAYEAPLHRVRLDPYWIERTEVTNQRYLDFLVQAAQVELETPLGRADTPLEIVTALVGERAPADWDVETTARQMVAANRAAIHAALPFLVVVDPATHAVDEEATWQRLRDAPLPPDVRLVFYDRAPPQVLLDPLLILASTIGSGLDDLRQHQLQIVEQAV